MDTKILKNRAECMNAVNKYVNNVVPLLINELKKGFQVKSGNESFFKKDKERLDKILCIGKGGTIRAWIQVDKYAIILNVDGRYSTGENGCDYFKQYPYLYDRADSKYYKFEPLKLTTLKELEQAQIRLRELEEKASEIRSEQSAINLLLGN